MDGLEQLLREAFTAGYNRAAWDRDEYRQSKPPPEITVWLTDHAREIERLHGGPDV